MSASKVYFISGANRGIGFSIVQQLIKRDNTVVFAGARDPVKATDLKALADKSSGRLHIVKLTSASEEDNAAAIKEVEQKAGHIDVLIANAGIARMSGNIATTRLEDFTEQWNVNVLGPVILFRAAYELLRKSKNAQFFVISSAAGGMTNMFGGMPNGAYGSSKAAVNFFAKKLSYEEDFLTSVSFHPGMVASDMGSDAIKQMGFTHEDMKSNFGVPVLTPEESGTALVKLFDEVTKEKHNGKFFSYDGSELQW